MRTLREVVGFVIAISVTLVLAFIVGAMGVFFPRPALGFTKPDAAIGDRLFAMVMISQPLKIDAKVYEDHEVIGSLYSTVDSCLTRAKQEMESNKMEMMRGIAKSRVFAGCIAIPAPGHD